jgi:hypothetical protein
MAEPISGREWSVWGGGERPYVWSDAAWEKVYGGEATEQSPPDRPIRRDTDDKLKRRTVAIAQPIVALIIGVALLVLLGLAMVALGGNHQAPSSPTPCEVNVTC